MTTNSLLNVTLFILSISFATNLYGQTENRQDHKRVFKLKFDDNPEEIRLDPAIADENPFEIDSTWISSISILKDEKSLTQYSNEGYNEVVIIELKRSVEKKVSEAIRKKFKPVQNNLQYP